MDLTEFVEVREETSEHGANHLLGKGWQLLAVSPGSSADGRDQIAYLKYSLGRKAHIPE